MAVTDEATPHDDQPDAAGGPRPSSADRNMYSSLGQFATIQRQLATIDFAALSAAQQAVEAATAGNISRIAAIQNDIAQNFARSVDLAAVAQAHKLLCETGATASAAIAQKRWAESLTSSIHLPALRAALESTSALDAYAKSAFSDLLRQQTRDILSRIGPTITIALPKIDFTSLREALDRWIPTNLRGLSETDLDAAAAVALDEGIPVSWIPRAEIVIVLVNAHDAATRLKVLEARRDEILDDCETALSVISHEWAVQCREATSALRAGFGAAAQSHASNIIDSIVLGLHGRKGRDRAKESAQEDFDDLPLQVAAENLTIRPLFRAFTPWWPDTGEDPPEYFARHATSHAVGHVGVFAPLSALVAVMLATSLTVQYSPADPVDPHNHEP